VCVVCVCVCVCGVCVCVCVCGVCVSLRVVKCNNNIYHEYIAAGQAKKEDYQKMSVCSSSETATVRSTISPSHSSCCHLPHRWNINNRDPITYHTGIVKLPQSRQLMMWPCGNNRMFQGQQYLSFSNCCSSRFRSLFFFYLFITFSMLHY